MKRQNIICKIYFFDKELKKTKRIFGVININQLFSSLDEFLELKNYGNKTILKKDLVKVVLYEDQHDILKRSQLLELNSHTKIEG